MAIYAVVECCSDLKKSEKFHAVNPARIRVMVEMIIFRFDIIFDG